MDVREKLVELIYDADKACNNKSCVTCKHQDKKFFCKIHFYIDHLIDNSVTVQEWISVKDRLPENEQWALCFMKDKSFGTFRVFQWNYIDWQWNDGNEWFDEKDVTHWMPLPQPPKGE